MFLYEAVDHICTSTVTMLYCSCVTLVTDDGSYVTLVADDGSHVTLVAEDGSYITLVADDGSCYS